MASKGKGSQILTANRTGVPVVYDYEINDMAETRKGTWLAVIAVAIAFALILHMESDRARTRAEKTASTRIAAVMQTS